MFIRTCLAVQFLFEPENAERPLIFLHSVLDVERWTLDVARPFPGGVAERLIAPVLKTGRPKGLVSSNLTPSASDSRFSTADFRYGQEEDAL